MNLNLVSVSVNCIANMFGGHTSYDSSHTGDLGGHTE